MPPRATAFRIRQCSMVRTALFAMHSMVGREMADHWDALSASERYV